MDTTVGQILVNDALPEEMRDYSRPLDKKSVQRLFTEVAEQHPEQYAAISQKLHSFAHQAVTRHGNEASLTLDSLRTPPEVQAIHADINKGIAQILAGKDSDKVKDDRIVELISKNIDPVTKANYEAGLRQRNPLALQVASGSRGNASQFRSLRGGDMLVVDHKDRPIPIPILSSFSEGLDPVQYWAGAYGARKGTISTKFATPKSGFLGKQLAMATHRLIVTEKDCGTGNGIPTPANDPDNEGAVLARDVGEVKAGTVLTPRIIKQLGDAKIIVRSPMTCHAEQGICQRCAGVRERGGFPPIGDNLGVAASQAISEPIGQGQLSAKHSGGQSSGQARAAKTGIDLINQIVQVPKTFQGAAAVSTAEGDVERIEPAPQGGTYVTISGQQHWVPPGEQVTVEKGGHVEAGDVLSTGIPNPAEIVAHKGIGEGRRYFMEQFRKTLDDNKFSAHRRNIELLSRGLINHVRITDPDGPHDTAPDDVVEYDDMVRGYQPRFGFQMVHPKQAKGLFLEEPILHYSIGTKVTPNVSKLLTQHDVGPIKVHADPPSFQPEMMRAMETLSHSNDWMVRLGGFNLGKGLKESIHRNRESDTHGTSFIPALAHGVDFGKPPKGEVGY
jgi:DNA-directed RNA polymerase subunit beta'